MSTGFDAALQGAEKRFDTNLLGALASTGISRTILLAAIVAIITYILNLAFPKWGLYTVLIPGFLAVGGMVIYRVSLNKIMARFGRWCWRSPLSFIFGGSRR